MAAYAIQVVLTVMFALIYLLVDGYVRFSSRKSSHAPTPTPEQPDTSRLPGLTGPRRPQLELLLRQVDRCFDVFWISSIYFSLAVSVATFVINTKTKAASHYTVFFSFLGVVFSSSAIGALAPWYRPRAGARSGGSYFYIFFVTISMVVIIVSVSSYFNRTRFQDADSNFETFCLSHLPTYRAMINFLLFTVALAGIAWAGFLASHIGCLARSRFAGAMSTFRTIIKRAISSASFLLMCTSLGFFLRLRYESEKLVDENKDQVDDWGFGQIVAVAVWLPMFIEFISVFCKFGSDDSLFNSSEKLVYQAHLLTSIVHEGVVLREFKQKRKVNGGDGGVASDTPGTDRVPQNGHEERSKNPEKVKLVTSWGTTMSR